MAGEVWINLPTGDIEKSKDFYLKLGYVLREQAADSNGIVQLSVDQTNSIINLLEETEFTKLSGSRGRLKNAGAEMVITIDAESKDEVKDFYTKARNAGARILSTPHLIEKGFEFTFADPDDHRWKILFREEKTPLIKSFFDGQDKGFVNS